MHKCGVVVDNSMLWVNVHCVRGWLGRTLGSVQAAIAWRTCSWRLKNVTNNKSTFAEQRLTIYRLCCFKVLAEDVNLDDNVKNIVLDELKSVTAASSNTAQQVGCLVNFSSVVRDWRALLRHSRAVFWAKRSPFVVKEAWVVFQNSALLSKPLQLRLIPGSDAPGQLRTSSGFHAFYLVLKKGFLSKSTLL